MEEKRPQPYESFARRHQAAVDSAVTLLEWLLVAFILALMFMTFAMQAFQIPTGSMAETLRGKHYNVRCPRCGYVFDINNESFIRPTCPNCGYVEPAVATGHIKNGDRIFVLKSIYQFLEPKRWDVVVFKNPTDPQQNYIKRLLGLPGEEVQIINGDLYINHQIQRKPPRVQEELWMPICLADHQPLEAADHFNELVRTKQGTQNKLWEPFFENDPNSKWRIDGPVFYLDDTSTREHTLVLKHKGPNAFRAVYGYNNEANWASQPMVSDLMIRFYAKGAESTGYVGACLEKYGVLYSARVDFSGRMQLAKTVDGKTTLLRTPLITDAVEAGKMMKFEFADVDHQLILKWGRIRYTYDLANDPDFHPQDASTEKPPQVKVFASGPTQIHHLQLYRDIFYQGKEDPQAIRAIENKPFTLGPDEFFMCGDNCNNSYDGRCWSEPGKGNRSPEQYRAGVVPRDYLMGKAVMVYWAQPFEPVPDSIPMVPNLGDIKVIYGGSNEVY